MTFALWELILFIIICKVMISSQTIFCEQNNISVYDCDYNDTSIKHCCILVGYLVGKKLFFNF
jgi:hypothetical protein